MLDAGYRVLEPDQRSQPYAGMPAAVLAAMRDHRLASDERSASSTATSDAPVAGRTTLVELASRGVAGEATALPYADVIQRSFGHHSIAGVRAHIGGASAEAAHALGANAYTVGESIAFAQPPDLRLAAHEAAHVIQQRRGVRLFGGIGAAGDEYERHADAVADRVVAGQSAEALLDELGRGTAHAAVQRDERHAQPETHTAETSSLHGIGHLVPTMAVGRSYKIDVGLRVPLPLADHVELIFAGRLTLDCARTQDGYEVGVTPRLALGLTAGSFEGVLLTEGRIQVRAATHDSIGGLIEVALEHAIRASGQAPPRFITLLLATNPIGQLVNLADIGARLYNYQQTGQLQSQFWPWLADALFDRAQIRATRAGMHDGEYAETRDRVGGGAAYRRDGAEVVHERRWRLDDDREITNEVIEATLTYEAASVKVRYLRPSRGFAGECSVDASIGFRNAAVVFLTAATIRGLFEAALVAVRSGELDAVIEHSCWTALATAMQTFLRNPGSSARGTQIGFSVTIPFDGSDISASVKMTSALDITTEGNGVTFTQGRVFGPAMLPGIRVEHRAPRGAEHATMSGRAHRR